MVLAFAFSVLTCALLACAPRVARGPTVAPLAITTDSATYHYSSEPREPGAFRVRLIARLRNSSADTVFLAGLCGAAGRPARWFLQGASDEEAALALWGCVGAVDGSTGEAEPAFFSIPPHAEFTDTVWLFARPRAVPTPSRIPWEQLAGEFRVAYQRMERSGWPSRRWVARARIESVSQPFRLVRPNSE